MTKRTTTNIDMTRISDSHRRQIERVVSIGAKIGVDQQKKHQDILKAITRSFDAMVDAMGADECQKLFGALIGAATAADAKKIRQHPGFVEKEGGFSKDHVEATVHSMAKTKGSSSEA